MSYYVICNDEPPTVFSGTGSDVISNCTTAQLVDFDMPLQPMSIDNFYTVAPETLLAFTIAFGFRWLRKSVLKY